MVKLILNKIGIFLIFILFSSLVFSLDFSLLERNLSMSRSLKTDEAIKKRIEELSFIIKEINIELEKNPDSAKLTFLKGRAIYSYVYTIKPPFNVNDLENIKSIKADAHVWLSKSAQYNDGDLTFGQLYVLKDVSSELATYAVDQILATDHYFDDKERVELRRNKIDHLIRLHRFDEALNEIKILNEKFPNFASVEWDDAFLGEIEKAKETNKTEYEEKETKIPVVKPVAAKISPEVISTEAEKLVLKSSKDSDIKSQALETENNILWYVGLVILIVLLLIFYRRKQYK
jgi:hypothetical protein